jgi:pimeloyl-ACP methyl ester carboxylesterase
LTSSDRRRVHHAHVIEIVLLPGLDGTGRLLGAFCARLSALGVRAHALAYPTDEPMDYDNLERWIRARLPGPGQPFVVLGESFSGPLAIRIAARPPANLMGVVLSTTFAASPVPRLSSMSALARFAPTRLPAALFSWLLLGPWSTAQRVAALQCALRDVHPDVLRTRARAALTIDVTHDARLIARPVLQLIATDDRLLAPTVSRSLGALLPTARPTIVRGPHLLLQVAVDECAARVAEFLTQIAAADQRA